MALTDFADPTKPVEVVLSLSGFARNDQALFPKELSFSGTLPTLRIGVRAEWNATEEEVSTICGFPDLGWKASSRQQRDALKAVWLPAFRDPTRMLHLASNRGFWTTLLVSGNINTALITAVQEIEAAIKKLGKTADLTMLMEKLRDSLSALIPGVDSNAFALGRPVTSNTELLSEFGLMLRHGGPSLPVGKQSNGLIQLAVFALALRALAGDQNPILLIDEPEISLHPQAQRSLSAACMGLPNQAIIATHSSNVLDRVDMRRVVRLQGSKGNITAMQASSLGDDEAQRLARFVNPLTAEACFAKKVVLVEGYSDRVVLLRLSNRRARDLDAEGVTVLSLDGGGTVGTYLRLFGKQGLGLTMLGLCDDDKVSKWLAELQKAGEPIRDRAGMKAAGFSVCSRDLEAELIRALGVSAAEALIAREGEAASFAHFQKQPVHAGAPLEEQLRRYFHADSIRWALPLADALDLGNLPGPLNDILAAI